MMQLEEDLNLSAGIISDVNMSAGSVQSASPHASNSTSNSSSSSHVDLSDTEPESGISSDFFDDDIAPSSVTSDDDSSEFDGIPPLLAAGYSDSEQETASESESGEGDKLEAVDFEGILPSSGLEGDDEGSDIIEEDFKINPKGSSIRKLGRYVRQTVEHMYSSRYQASRTHFPRGPATMRHVLDVLKLERPDHFRQELRVNPLTFDQMVQQFINDPIFFNNSPN
jgi:hypothetical protein